MATIQEISEIKSHPNADRLELATVLGYQAVVGKGEFAKGDVIVYVEPDNVLPEDAEWATEYRKYAPKRIKAVRLRKEWSEGLVINITVYKNVAGVEEVPEVGTDISEILGVVHYEPPTPANLAAQGIIANLPYQLPKTDEKRWETIVNKLPVGITVDVTLKVDGQSWSAYYRRGSAPSNDGSGEDDAFGVLGRWLEFPLDVENDYTDHLARYDIQEKLGKYCREHSVSLCIRGESYGGGIQRSNQNPHCELPKGLMIFSVYLIDEHRYAGRDDRFYFKRVCEDLELPAVPIVEEGVELTVDLCKKYSTGMEKLNGKPFEGVVIKGADFSCKVINKKYDSNK